MTLFNPLTLTQNLIRCPSVTPLDAGALDVVQQSLEQLGFTCHRLKFEDVDNLYARLGTAQPNFCFAGHTDVVPVGDATAWQTNPFAAEIKGNILYGRGAADMKAAIAAFISATATFLENRKTFNGSISFLITGDEEGIAINGTKKVLEWLAEKGEKLDFCLVGEPTNPHFLGEMIKNGRRGSMNGYLTIHGKQGHAAYPERAKNPIPLLLQALQNFLAQPLDSGTEFFQPSNLEITSVDVGNTVTNIIPATAKAQFNIRFNTAHTSESLTAWLHEQVKKVTADYTLEIQVSGDAFLTPPCPEITLIQDATEKVTGKRAVLSTTGGTSDARFIKNYCPVVEFGIVGATMHQVNEAVYVEDIYLLTEIYNTVLSRYFAM
jgi:succinyl-diaminopimelate desuccinylase